VDHVVVIVLLGGKVASFRFGNCWLRISLRNPLKLSFPDFFPGFPFVVLVLFPPPLPDFGVKVRLFVNQDPGTLPAACHSQG
jgi:hypothetical protein